MRGRLDDPVSDIDLALDEALGMTTRREIARAQDEAGKARRFPGLHVFFNDASLGRAIRRLRITGAGATASVAGDTVTLSITGGSGGTITVQEGDVTVDSAASTLDFDASDFNVTSSPSGEANIALAYGTSAGTPAEGNHTHAYEPADATLTALAAYNTNGLIAQTAADTFAGRTLTAGSGKVTVTNGNGVSGNPTVDLGTVALDDLSDVAITALAEGEALTHNGTNVVDAMHVNFTIGPFYLANPTTSGADQVMGIGVPTAAATWGQSTNHPKMSRSGRVIGMILNSNAARTGGTLTGRVYVAGAGAAFSSGACALDATNTTSDSEFVGYVNGVAFSAGNTLGMSVTGASWTPTTADITGWLIVQLAAYTG